MRPENVVSNLIGGPVIGAFKWDFLSFHLSCYCYSNIRVVLTFIFIHYFETKGSVSHVGLHSLAHCSVNVCSVDVGVIWRHVSVIHTPPPPFLPIAHHHDNPGQSRHLADCIMPGRCRKGIEVINLCW